MRQNAAVESYFSRKDYGRISEMSFYPPRISEKFDEPQNAGQVDSASAAAMQATFVCGAVLRLTMRIDQASGQIEEAKFQTDGCGFLIAAAETLTEKITNQKLSELHGLDEKTLAHELENELGIFPPEKKHCLNLAIKTLQAAFGNFRRAQLNEWTGEKALVCTCFGVSEETIENLVEQKSLQTIEDVTRECRAGGGCGSCQPLIQEILDTTQREA
jgi:NifU-like protein